MGRFFIWILGHCVDILVNNLNLLSFGGSGVNGGSGEVYPLIMDQTNGNIHLGFCRVVTLGLGCILSYHFLNSVLYSTPHSADVPVSDWPLLMSPHLANLSE